MTRTQDASPLGIVLTGMLALASAMGIGRFAFTPLLPLMQDHAGLTLAQGGWLAASNYAGYLAGAVWCVLFTPPPGTAARTGLAGVAISTLAMALTSIFEWWLFWRFLAGAASALVLVGISVWTLAQLARAGRPSWAGWVFAGVGVGIAYAGLVSLVMGIRGTEPRIGWLILGVTATLVLLPAWPQLSASPVMVRANAAPRSQRFDLDAWLLVCCYGIFGFGYIIPATFLPALARQLVPDPLVFGWSWPVFGFAAAISTVAASLLRNATPRRTWAACHVVMALGIVALIMTTNAGTLLFSAIAVGGTFMVLTTAGMQEARRVGGNGSPRLMAAMTAAFAIGQLLGPVAVSMLPSGTHGLYAPSIVAAALLIATVPILLVPHRSKHIPSSI